MNRRNFFRQMIGGVAAAAAVRTWPFRVYSFPSELRILNPIVRATTATNYFSGCTPSYIARIQALELENLAEEIPDLIRNESTLWPLLARRTIVGINQSKGIVTMS